MMLGFTCWVNSINSRPDDPFSAHLKRYSGKARTAIDAGANIGLYTHPLSKIFRRVYAFEINKDITGMIKQYNPGNIELVECGLSSQAGTAILNIPVNRGCDLSGYASLDRSAVLEEVGECIERECQLVALDDFGITEVDFIKIDVEGHELEVLKGGAKTIAQWRPVVFAEVRTAKERQVEEWFRDMNYRQCRFNENGKLVALTELVPSVGDSLYVPVERLGEFGIEG
jgi:FkbM family methyltransferase